MMFVGVARGIDVGPLGRRLDREIVDGEVDVSLDLVHVSVVERFLVVAGALRVPASLDFADTGDVGARIAVDHHVRHVDTDDVVRLVVAQERPVGEQAALAGEGIDPGDGVGVGDRERQDGVGHRTVGNLFVDREHVATPVAARSHLSLGVDDDLGAAAAALHGDQGVGGGVDVGGARAHRRAGQRREIAVGDRLVEASLGPLVAAEQADQHSR